MFLVRQRGPQNGKLPIKNSGGGNSKTVDWKWLRPIVDLTFVDPELMGHRLDWKVSDHYTGSDHFAILYHLQDTTRRLSNPRSRRWALATIISVCDALMSIKGNPYGRPPIYWWNEDIVAVRRECLRVRRLHQRARNKPPGIINNEFCNYTIYLDFKCNFKSVVFYNHPL